MPGLLQRYFYLVAARTVAAAGSSFRPIVCQQQCMILSTVLHYAFFILHMGKCLYPGCGDWEDNMLVLVFQYWLDFTPWHFANFTSVLAFISILFLFIGNEGFQLILSFFICRSKKCAQPAVTRTTRPKVLCELYFCPKPYAINKKYSS